MGNLLLTCDFCLPVHQVILLAENPFLLPLFFVLNSNISRVLHSRRNLELNNFNLRMIDSVCQSMYLTYSAEIHLLNDLAANIFHLQTNTFEVAFPVYYYLQKSLEDMFSLTIVLIEYGTHILERCTLFCLNKCMILISFDHKVPIYSPLHLGFYIS